MSNNDSPGSPVCFAIFGIILIFLGSGGLWQVHFALLHHTVMSSMNVPQVILLCSISLVLGLSSLAIAMKRKKKATSQCRKSRHGIMEWIRCDAITFATNHFSNLNATVASGGRWIKIECSRPIHCRSSLRTPP